MIIVLIILCITTLLSAILWLICQNPRHKIQAFLGTQVAIGIMLIYFTNIQLALSYLIGSIIFVIVILFYVANTGAKPTKLLFTSRSVFRNSALFLIIISVIVVTILLIQKLHETGTRQLATAPQLPERYWIFVLLLSVLFILLLTIFKKSGAQND